MRYFLVQELQDLVPDHATNTRTGACSVPRPGKEPYEGGLLVFHESSKSSKGLGFRV